MLSSTATLGVGVGGGGGVRGGLGARCSCLTYATRVGDSAEILASSLSLVMFSRNCWAPRAVIVKRLLFFIKRFNYCFVNLLFFTFTHKSLAYAKRQIPESRNHS